MDTNAGMIDRCLKDDGMELHYHIGETSSGRECLTGSTRVACFTWLKDGTVQGGFNASEKQLEKEIQRLESLKRSVPDGFAKALQELKA